MAIRDVQDGVLDDLGLRPWLEGVRQRCKGLDPLVHLLGDGPEQAGDLCPGLDLQPLAVALIGEMDDLRLQLHYPLVGRIIVNDLPLAARLLRRRRSAVWPGNILVITAGGDVRDDRATDAMQLSDRDWVNRFPRSTLMDKTFALFSLMVASVDRPGIERSVLGLRIFFCLVPVPSMDELLVPALQVRSLEHLTRSLPAIRLAHSVLKSRRKVH